MSGFICRSCVNTGIDMLGNVCACQRKRPGSDTTEAKLRQREQITVERERRKSSDLSMMDITRYISLHQAHELAIRLNEMYEAMLIVERCGASPELTEAVGRLGERMRHIQADLVSACKDATGSE